MSRIGFLLLLVLVSSSVFAQKAKPAPALALIPEPVQVAQTKGTFELTAKTVIVLPKGHEAHLGVAQLLSQRLQVPTGFALPVKVGARKKNSIQFQLFPQPQPELGSEGYTLEVTPQAILLQANAPAGWFYGIQTLLQLLPPAVESKQTVAGVRWEIAGVKIKDYPRLAWRGLMVDVSRHFFPKEVMKAYIDQMAKYKLNTFHWHLTDNQGWRVEIKSLPKLTQVGAWRVPRTGYWKGFQAPQPGEAATDGGFYSQEDIKEIIRYAEERFVTIVPEVDVPGHSLALIASYPNLSCTQTPQQVLAGDPWNPQRTNVLCVGNDSTFTELEKVFSELAQLFPGEYLHMGGDEVTRSYWDKCAKCQQRIKTEGLKNSEELQTYFLKRLARIIQSKGKKPMGWYEKLEGRLAPNMAVMSWKDMKGGIAASQQGHKVVMTPAFNTYLDFYQGDPYLENGPFTVTRLNATYNWNPVPLEANAANILGGQGSLWTEQVAHERKLQSMTWPRALSLAEVFWTPQPKRQWENFIPRLEAHLPRLDAAEVNYATHFYEPIVWGVKDSSGALQVVLSSEIRDIEMYYTFDDSNPDKFYPKYQGQPLDIPKGAHHIRVVSYRHGQRVGREINLPLSEVEKRVRK
ncbi:beta-N-acetylhexosaminidase [Rufibacter immobilis]|uniref:beta-N-acetylhexosaminidase n=1 Tax=Rufibacter immobilis TaxID=1348778 RepID=A0A3M9MWM7_9BACT|nr:family 20 glycosylhydrolase [Rufibacter immobilis]RNI29926.1 beta-N-acetylhexosaminidase [Rufibacter immobilis]